MPTVYKDPADVIPQAFDWAVVIPNDTIATSTWTPPAGITTSLSSFVGKITTIWVAGGTAGETYKVINKITTTGGQTRERTLHVRVKDQ